MVEATRFKNAWLDFATRYKAKAKAQDQLPTTHPIVADIPDVESVHLNFDSITYEKGASVLKQLVAWVGEEAFFKGDQRRTSAATSTATRSCPTSWARSRRRPAATSRRGRGCGSSRPASTRIGAELEVDGDRIKRSDPAQTRAAEHPTLRPHRLRRRPVRPAAARR